MTFPVDDVTLVMLASACEINEETGRTHLQDFLDMGARVKSLEDITAEVFGEYEADDADTPRVFLAEHESGYEPFSPHAVISALVVEIQRLRAFIEESEG